MINIIGHEIVIRRGSRIVFVGKSDNTDDVFIRFTNKGSDTYLRLSQEAAVAMRVLLDNEGVLGKPKVLEYADEPTAEWAPVDQVTGDNKGETPCKPKKPRAKRRPAKS
jgi:hypothetical protein